MRDLLEKLESEMRHKFEVVRSKFENSGNKGTNTEAILREFLRSYLPRRYGVGHGEIVDSLGGRSAQTDIVIVTDEHASARFPAGGRLSGQSSRTTFQRPGE